MRAESLGPATARLIVGSEACETVRDDQFSVLRRAESIEDDFLSDNFDFASLSAGGGKGGDSMARTKDKRFFVKFLNDSDGKSLLEDSFLREYVARASSACRRVESKRRRRCSRATCTTNRTSSSTAGRC